MVNKKDEWMQTVSGRRFFPFDPKPEDVFIEDIAHGLANACRFSGQSLSFYSVAEHCVHCANMAKPEHKLQLILHDASEGLLGDMNRILKRHMPEFQAVENAVQEAIRIRFGIATFDFPELHEIDNRVLMTEKRDIMSESPEPWAVPFVAYPPEVLTVEGWSPRVAKHKFLDLFNDLYQDGNN